MNNVNLIGNLTKDPEVKTVIARERETKVANFTVATTRYFKKKDGENSQETTFVPCEAWDTGAASIEKILSKGDPVAITGSLKMEQWKNKDGENRSKLKIRVNTFRKLNRAPIRNSVDTTEEGKSEGAGDGNDIPF